MREKPLILLVDDELDFLEIISVKLGTSGFEVVTAHNAAEAIVAAKKIQPDLILMDVSMPGETGTDATLSIKQDAETRRIKVILLSNMKDPWPRTPMSRETVARGLGAEDFIDKGDDLDAIVARVRMILERQDDEVS